MMWRRANRISDDELDWAIRSTLQAETDGLEPSPQVWERVRARIITPQPERDQQGRAVVWHARLANVVQGAILAVLVLGFGLGLSRGFPATGWTQPAVPTAVIVHTKAPSRYPKDMLNGKRLLQLNQQKSLPGAWRWPQ